MKTDEEIQADAAGLLAQGADPVDVGEGLETAETDEERDYFRRLLKAMTALIVAECALEDARQLVEAFGKDAEMEAALRADAAIEQGDPAGEHRWRNALAQVRLLEANAEGPAN